MEGEGIDDDVKKVNRFTGFIYFKEREGMGFHVLESREPSTKTTNICIQRHWECMTRKDHGLI